MINAILRSPSNMDVIPNRPTLLTRRSTLSSEFDDEAADSDGSSSDGDSDSNSRSSTASIVQGIGRTRIGSTSTEDSSGDETFPSGGVPVKRNFQTRQEADAKDPLITEPVELHSPERKRDRKKLVAGRRTLQPIDSND